MIRYYFLDGPLEGQTVGSTMHEAVGHVLDVEVVDVGDRAGGTAPLAYRVVTASGDLNPGTLRYVAGTAEEQPRPLGPGVDGQRR
jgi:hypothetical protein